MNPSQELLAKIRSLRAEALLKRPLCVDISPKAEKARTLAWLLFDHVDLLESALSKE